MLSTLKKAVVFIIVCSLAGALTAWTLSTLEWASFRQGRVYGGVPVSSTNPLEPQSGQKARYPAFPAKSLSEIQRKLRFGGSVFGNISQGASGGNPASRPMLSPKPHPNAVIDKRSPRRRCGDADFSEHSGQLLPRGSEKPVERKNRKKISKKNH